MWYNKYVGISYKDNEVKVDTSSKQDDEKKNY